MSIRTCSKCILPSNYKTISFDKDGVCNYCRTYEQLQGRLTDYSHLQSLLEDRIQRFRGKYEYDCLLGLSGGKDSSYVAMRAVRHHELKALAITFDNGWLTDYAKQNIAQVVSELGIDHQYYQIDWDLHKQFYREIVNWFGVPCPGCSYATGLLSQRVSTEKKIPLVFHGRSRSQMFRELAAGSSDIFINFVRHNLQPYDPELIRSSFLTILERVEMFLKHIMPDQEMRAEFRKEFFPPLDVYKQSELVPELIGYFLYYPYDEQAMMKELEEELNWQPPDDKAILTHNDCLVHDAVGYLYPRVFGFPLLSFELSVLIREGVISKDEALKRLAQEENTVQTPEESLEVLCQRLDFKREQLPQIVDKVRNRNKWFNRVKKVKNFISRPKLDL
jgi:tRNA(Ile)-lysidine synthase TilS/MesJ